MKILHVIDSGGLYGAEVMLLHLAEEQLKQGCRPVIASISAPGLAEKAIDRAAKAKNIPVHSFIMRPGINLKGAMALVRFARESGVQLIHSHGYKGNILLGILPRKLRKVPIVATLHGYTASRRFSKMQVYEWLDARVLKRLDAIVLVNGQMKKHPRLRKLRHSRLVVIDNGIPLSRSADTLLTTPEEGAYTKCRAAIEKFCGEGIILGSVGRYSFEKGFDLLIHATKDLRERGITAKLLLIGEGGAREQLERLIALHGLEESVLLAGYHPRASTFMPLLDIYVISSHTEGLPITLLETMRAGTPVVATAVGGIPEVLDYGRCGTVVTPGDKDALVEGIEKMLGAPDTMEKMSDLAKERFAAHYSAEKMSLEYKKLYTRLVDEYAGACR